MARDNSQECKDTFGKRFGREKGRHRGSCVPEESSLRISRAFDLLLVQNQVQESHSGIQGPLQ